MKHAKVKVQPIKELGVSQPAERRRTYLPYYSLDLFTVSLNDFWEPLPLSGAVSTIAEVVGASYFCLELMRGKHGFRPRASIGFSRDLGHARIPDGLPFTTTMSRTIMFGEQEDRHSDVFAAFALAMSWVLLAESGNAVCHPPVVEDETPESFYHMLVILRARDWDHLEGLLESPERSHLRDVRHVPEVNRRVQL